MRYGDVGNLAWKAPGSESGGGKAIVIDHRRAPSALTFTARAFLRSPSLPRRPQFPDLTQRWTGVRLVREHEAGFRNATGCNADSVLYPHVLGFRLQMALLTHPAFPMPLWKALQVRNLLVRHRPLDRNVAYAIETCVGDHRAVEKGLEVDVHTRMTAGSRCDWESIVTYFYRGRFDAAPGAGPPNSPDLSAASPVATIRMPESGGLAFGKLTGDYNGIHWWPAYARLFGFKSAFLHSQRVVGLCLAQLDRAKSEAETLALWLKGPVFYGSDVLLSAVSHGDRGHFGLSLAEDPRHAIVGSWQGSLVREA